MANYYELDQIIDNIVFEKILRNQEICRLLTYYPDDAEQRYNFDPFNPDLPDVSGMDLFMKNVYPLPKMPDAKTAQECFICVTLSGGYSTDTNIFYRNVNVLFDVICHLNSWRTAYGSRVYYIMHQISDMINNRLTDLPIENKPTLVGFQARDYSHYFYGAQLKFNMIINTDIVCPQLPKNLFTDDCGPKDLSFLKDN